MPKSRATILTSVHFNEAASEGATKMSSVAANRVSRAAGDEGSRRSRVVVLEDLDSKSLGREVDFERIRFEDLPSLSDVGKCVNILFVDLDALDSKKRAGLITHIGRATNVRAIALEDGVSASNSERLLRAGFAGVLPRDCPSEVFLRAIDSVRDGQLWFPREIISRVLKGFLIEEDLNRLTSREIEIVRLIGSGMNNQKIADMLFISRETVRWHVRGLNAKLGTKDRHSLRDYVKYLRSGEQKIPSTSVQGGRRSAAS